MGAEQVDWQLIARRFGAAAAVMIHQEKTDLHGDQFDAEAIRRAITGTARDLDGRMIEGHRDVGLTPTSEAQEATERAVRTWKFNADQAAAEAEKWKNLYLAEVNKGRRDRDREAAEIIRVSVNENSLPSRYRREGALWAADLLCRRPATPATSDQ